MSAFPIHTLETAPADARPVLEQVQAKLGSVPNLFGTFAGSPALLAAYLQVGELFDTTAFDATERQIVLMAASHENGCDYCMAAHSVISGMQGVPADVVAGLRDGTPLADPRHEALRRFTHAMVATRGRPTSEEVDAFHAAGYDGQAGLEVILGISLKTLSNYTNHLADTPLDAAFQPQAWSDPAAAAH